MLAVGDVRCGNIKRVAPAVGEGSIAISFVWRSGNAYDVIFDVSRAAIAAERRRLAGGRADGARLREAVHAGWTHRQSPPRKGVIRAKSVTGAAIAAAKRLAK